MLLLQPGHQVLLACNIRQDCMVLAYCLLGNSGVQQDMVSSWPRMFLRFRFDIGPLGKVSLAACLMGSSGLADTTQAIGQMSCHPLQHLDTHNRCCSTTLH